MAPTVLITGAGGNIGMKVRAHFTTLGWKTRLLDIASGGDSAIATADLSVWDNAWVELFADVDAVVHLAGRPSSRTSWADAVRYNLHLMQNVYEAAVRQHSKRLIFASSKCPSGIILSVCGRLWLICFGLTGLEFCHVDHREPRPLRPQ